MRVRGVACTRRTRSILAMMDPARRAVHGQVAAARDRSAAQIPFVSNVSGTWITEAATDPRYWGRQLRAAGAVRRGRAGTPR